jgi:hypothetical protein
MPAQGGQGPPGLPARLNTPPPSQRRSPQASLAAPSHAARARRGAGSRGGPTAARAGATRASAGMLALIEGTSPPSSSSASGASPLRRVHRAGQRRVGREHRVRALRHCRWRGRRRAVRLAALAREARRCAWCTACSTRTEVRQLEPHLRTCTAPSSFPSHGYVLAAASSKSLVAAARRSVAWYSRPPPVTRWAAMRLGRPASSPRTVASRRCRGAGGRELVTADRGAGVQAASPRRASPRVRPERTAPPARSGGADRAARRVGAWLLPGAPP